MYPLLRPFLFRIEPETIHNQTKKLALRVQGSSLIQKTLSSLYKEEHTVLEQTLWDIKFHNPVGLAAGFDKNGEMYPLFNALGFGFMEVGTVTHEPQEGNPQPRLFRLIKDKAIINRMGFNGEGAERICKNFLQMKSQNHPAGWSAGGLNKTRIALNIGKNKNIPKSEAIENYLQTFRLLLPYADMCVINVSSPNTPGLRELQEKNFLTELFQALNEEKNKNEATKNIPLLVKIAPELNTQQLFDILSVVHEQNLQGIVATNTSTERSGLHSQHKKESGGLSGLPLKKRSTKIIRFLFKESGGTIPIIGVGGIFTAEDAYEKIKAGASLIEVYTGLIYEGPGIVKKINKGLVKLLLQDGFKNISEAVGHGSLLS